MKTDRPAKIGDYVITDEIGRGAHGVVYRAHHSDRPDVPVALKKVESRGNLDQLLLEPEILSKLSHPGIVRLDDYFLDKESLTVALEFISGQDLQTELKEKGAIPTGEVISLLKQVASALDHAHAKGILHRDIKPSNILVERRPDLPPRFVLTDFGISRLSEGIQSTKRTGGTYLYMAPEQIRGRPQKASDLWSLGVLGYFLLTGEQPFIARTIEELSDEIAFTVPKPIKDANPSISDDRLEKIIFGLLEKNVSDRTTSSELIDQIDTAFPELAQGVPSNFQPSKAVQTGSFEKSLRRGIKLHGIGLVVSAILMGGLYGIIPQLLIIAGAIRFFQSESTKRPTTIFSFVSGPTLMLIGTVLSYYITDFINRQLLASGVDTKSLGYLIIVTGIFQLLGIFVFPFLVVYHLSRMRANRRDLNFREAISNSTAQPQEFIEFLREAVEQSPEDVRLRQRFIEALLANDRNREAAVESELLLEKDPYDFSGTLSLAQAYFALRLYERCKAVCNNYLSWTRYCYELEDLARRCEAKVQSLAGGNAAT